MSDSSFRLALDLASDSPPLRCFYSRFLREVRHDLDGAIDQLNVALALDPGAPRLLLEMARCNLEALSFSTARSVLDELLMRTSDVSASIARETWHLNCEYYIAHANFAVETKDYLAAVGSLEVLRREVESAPPSIFTSLRARLGSSLGAAWCLINEASDEGIRARAGSFHTWLRGIKGVRLAHVVPLSESRSVGSVKFVEYEKEFCFLESADHGEVYFHRSDLRTPADFPLLKRGMTVAYQLGASQRGRRGLEVEFG